MVALAGGDATTTRTQLDVLFRARWRALEPLTEARGPFVYKATRSRLRRVDRG